MKPTASGAKNDSGGHPAVTVVEITDPTASGENIKVIDQEVVQLHPMPLRVRRVMVQLADSMVVYQSTNLPVRTQTQVKTGLIAFVAFGPQAQGTFKGIQIQPELLLAAEAGVSGEFVVEAGYESIAIFFPEKALKMALENRKRENEFRFPQGIQILKASPSAARNVFDFGKEITTTAAKQPDLFNDHPTSREAAHIELLEILLAGLVSADDYEPTRGDLTSKGYSRIVQVAADFATSNTTERVSVTDLCKAAGASERTLQYAFKKIVGMTPIGYLTKLRLHRVREDLRKPKHGDITVSSAALRWGFWHFGDFSRAYGQCFGELPSDTLRDARR